jgi:3,4-dihydroxy-2-butanone 4-phosphate synthase
LTIIFCVVEASPPLSVTTDINKDSITFSITKGGGCVKYFIISIDGKKYNVTALKDKEMTRYTVNNLDPSTTYTVTVSVVSKGAETSQRQIFFKTSKNGSLPHMF